MRLPWGARWWEFVPELIVAVVLGGFALTEPSAAFSAFKSSTAIALMLITAVVWVGGRLLLTRFTRWPAARAALFTLAGAAVLTVVVVPAYDDTTVVEALPVTTTIAAAPPSTVVAPTLTGDASVPTSTPATTPVPTTRNISGTFRGVDHRASGNVRVIGQTLGLEDIDIQPGPDYDVYVVPGRDREDVDGGTRVDDLRGNKGTQYYELPAGIDLTTGDWSVVVWCQVFDVPVAAATLSR